MTTLYDAKKVTSWTVDRVSEVLTLEWHDLNPNLQLGVKSYGAKVAQISFEGQVHVALHITQQRFAEKDVVAMDYGFSLSPKPYDIDTHVLNTFDMGAFIGLFPQYSGTNSFTIAKKEQWVTSRFANVANSMHALIEVLLSFDSCFDLLTSDLYEVDGVTLDLKSLSLTHHLHMVKAYRLAEIYGHPEKCQEAVRAILAFAQTDQLTHERLESLRQKDPKKDANWLYSEKLLEKLKSV